MQTAQPSALASRRLGAVAMTKPHPERKTSRRFPRQLIPAPHESGAFPRRSDSDDHRDAACLSNPVAKSSLANGPCSCGTSGLKLSWPVPACRIDLLHS